MPKPSILITDSLFLPVGGEDEHRLRTAGYEIDRVDLPEADEQTLIEHIAGKAGYLLGGIETVTQRVVDASDKLEAIAFTGSGYADFIPAWKTATERGIAISAARGENARAVADWTLVSALALVRNIPALTTSGGPGFFISRDLDALTLGIVGFGAIGHEVATKARALGLTVVTAGTSDDPAVQAVPLDEVLRTSDIVCVHVSRGRGHGALDADAINAMKPGAVLVNAAFNGAIDNEALLERLSVGNLRAAVDHPLPSEGLPPGALLASNAQTGYNTTETNARVGARATTSLMNLLSTGDDPDLVNPDYITGRKTAT